MKAKNDARAEELAMNRRYKGGHQLLMENQTRGNGRVVVRDIGSAYGEKLGWTFYGF